MPLSLTLQSWHIHIKRSCCRKQENHWSLHIWNDNELFWDAKYSTESCSVTIFTSVMQCVMWWPSFDQLFAWLWPESISKKPKAGLAWNVLCTFPLSTGKNLLISVTRLFSKATLRLSFACSGGTVPGWLALLTYRKNVLVLNTFEADWSDRNSLFLALQLTSPLGLNEMTSVVLLISVIGWNTKMKSQEN